MASTPKLVENSKTNDSKKRLRSPAYPYLNLETAIKRAKTFHEHEQRNSAPVSVAATHWSYEAKSSGATQTAAALISFGLLQDEGTGTKRRLKLTQNALKILLDNRSDSPERDGLIKQAALAPKIHQQIWNKWPGGISDENLHHALLFDWEPPFNENSVDGFIKEYKDTIAFAKLTESDKVPSEDDDNGNTGSGQPYVPKVGDWVQVESNGTLRLPEPRRVREFSPDGKWAFVEGQHAGIPIEQLIQEKAPAASPQKPELHIPQSSNKLMQEYVVPLSAGARAVFQWPTTLSKEDIEDLKDTLKVLERKIVRSLSDNSDKEKSA